MKVHKYQCDVSPSDLAYTLGQKEKQTRLYIPNRGVLAFRGWEMDFFADDAEDIAEALSCISGRSKDPSVEYLGEVDLPDEKVEEFLITANELKVKKINLAQIAKNLIDRL